MASYLILGAGKFGRLAVKRLLEQDPSGRFVIIDKNPAALAAGSYPENADVVRIAADVIVFLRGNLSRLASWDWLIPMVPVHVALASLPDGAPDPCGREWKMWLVWRYADLKGNCT